MRRCQLSSTSIRRVCLSQDAARPILCRRDFHAVTQQREDDNQTTSTSVPRTRRASSAAAARDIQNLQKQPASEYSRYFRKTTSDVPQAAEITRSSSRSPTGSPSSPSSSERSSGLSSSVPKQVVFRGVRPASADGISAGTRGAGRGGFQRGGIRGGRGGAARGGARGGAEGTRRRAPGTMQSEEAEEDDEFGEDPMDASPETVLEDHPIFETESELQSYAELMSLVEGAEERYIEAADLATKAQKTNDSEMSRDADRATQRIDDDIVAGLAQLEATQNTIRPRYAPQEVPLQKFAREPGMVPVGPGGMGHVVEEALRLLAKRAGNEWENPQALAERLCAGHFVKFRNMPEKLAVIKIAGELGLARNGAKVGFASMDEAARAALVERVVKGRTGDVADAGLKNNTLKNIARLTNGNPTIPGDAKATLLKTVQSLLPAERTASSPKPSKGA